MKRIARLHLFLMSALFISTSSINAQDTIRTLPGHSTGTRKMVFSPSGNKLLTLGYNNQIKLWNIDTGKDTTVKSNPFELTYAIGYGKTDDDIYAVVENQCVYWNLQTGEKRSFEIFKISDKDKDHPRVTLSLVPYEGQLRLLDASGAVFGIIDNSVEVINQFNEIRNLFHNKIVWTTFSPGSELLAIQESKKMRIWNTGTGAQVRKIKTATGLSFSFGADLNYVRFSPDLQKMAMADGNKLLVWNLKDSQEVQKFDLGKILFQPILVYAFDVTNDRAFAVSPYALYWWTISDNTKALAFQIATNSGIGFFVNSDVTKVTYQEKGKIKLCEFPSGKILKEINGPGEFIVDPQWTRAAFRSGERGIVVIKLE